MTSFINLSSLRSYPTSTKMLRGVNGINAFDNIKKMNKVITRHDRVQYSNIDDNNIEGNGDINNILDTNNIGNNTENNYNYSNTTRKVNSKNEEFTNDFWETYRNMKEIIG